MQKQGSPPPILQGGAMAWLGSGVLVALLLALLLKHPELLGRHHVEVDTKGVEVDTLGLELPPSRAFEASFNGLAAESGGPCVASRHRHLLHELAGPLGHLASCEEEQEHLSSETWLDHG